MAVFLFFLKYVLIFAKGFFARPRTNPDATANMLVWDCGVPGKKGVQTILCLHLTLKTIWEGGLFPVTMVFSANYPSTPPLCDGVVGTFLLVIFLGHFPAQFFHPNVFTNGNVCLSIINEVTFIH